MLDVVNHPGHHHPLFEGYHLYISYGDPEPICEGCKQDAKGAHIFLCQEDGCDCEYILHDFCANLGRRNNYSYVDHPLHPQHPLTIQCDFKEFKCSFCKQTKKSSSSSGYLLHCAPCDFNLDYSCATTFYKNQQLLRSEYEFQFFFHHHTFLPSKYGLSPYVSEGCKACGFIFKDNEFVLKCSDGDCEYSVHAECSRVKKDDEMKYPLHPNHTLTLLHTPSSSSILYPCIACGCSLKYSSFVLQCKQCVDFYVDTRCAFLNPIFESDFHRHHLLVYFDDYKGPASCAVCNEKDRDMYRCSDCNFNIHKSCASLPRFVYNEDLHVDRFTLAIPLPKEHLNDVYFCDICDERRIPNRGFYSCEECPKFVAHFECVLPQCYMVGNPHWMSQEFIHDIKIKREVETLEVTSEDKKVISKMDMKVKEMVEIVNNLLQVRYRKDLVQKLVKLEANLKASYKEAKKMLNKLQDQLPSDTITGIEEEKNGEEEEEEEDLIMTDNEEEEEEEEDLLR